MTHPFLAALERRVLLADGALGTLLHDRGVPASACLDERSSAQRSGVMPSLHLRI